MMLHMMSTATSKKTSCGNPIDATCSLELARE